MSKNYERANVELKSSGDGTKFLSDSGSYLTYTSGSDVYVASVDSVFDLKSLSDMKNGDVVLAKNFWPDGADGGKGGGSFVYDATLDKSLHDMGKYVASDVSEGGWRRIHDKGTWHVNPFWYGAIGDPSPDYLPRPQRPISDYYSSIDDAKLDFPCVQTIDDECDWIGWAQALWSMEVQKRKYDPDTDTYTIDMQLNIELTSQYHFYINHPIWIRSGNYTNIDFGYSKFYYIGTESGTKDSPLTIIWFQSKNRNYSDPFTLIDDPNKTYSNNGPGFLGGTVSRFGGINLVGADTNDPDGHRYLVGVEFTSYAFFTAYQNVFRCNDFYVGVLCTGTGMMWQFTDCYFGESAGDAFYLSQFWGEFTTSLKMVRCEFQNFGRYGIFAYGGGTGIDYIFEDCDVEATIDRPINFYNRREWFVQGIPAAVCLLNANNCRWIRTRAESITSGAWAEYHFCDATMEVELVETARYIHTSRRSTNDSKADAYNSYLEANGFCIIDDEKNFSPAADGNHTGKGIVTYKSQNASKVTIYADDAGISLAVDNQYSRGVEYYKCEALPDTETVYPNVDGSDGYSWPLGNHDLYATGFSRGYIINSHQFYFWAGDATHNPILNLGGSRMQMGRWDWAKHQANETRFFFNSHIGAEAADGRYDYNRGLFYVESYDADDNLSDYREITYGGLSKTIVRDGYSDIPTGSDPMRRGLPWRVGDIVYFSDPAAQGFVGAVCTAEGIPGTWVKFGALEGTSSSGG